MWEAKDNIDMEERLEWYVIGRQPFQSIWVSGLKYLAVCSPGVKLESKPI